MNDAITIMTDEEVRCCRIPFENEESGFGSLRTEKGNLPLAALDVEGKITGLLSEIRLRQTFKNVHASPLEATYIFPLPDRAAVTSFRMEVNGRVIVGILKERGQAREDYDAAIQAGHRAAIAEEERPGTFTMRVGNLMPGETATVTLEMTNPLPFVDGEATFRFPLVVAPRYIPGTALGGEPVGDGTAQDTTAVPDASRITPPVLLPGFPNAVRLSLRLDIDAAGIPLGDVKSSLHTVATDVLADGARRVTFHPGERANRDFVLRLAYGANAVKTSVVVKEDEDGKGGTFALTIVPPVDVSKALLPRDVIFVLDRSGSMGGWKMVASRRACARMVDTLNDRDRFTVYAFDDSIEAPASFGGKGLVPATDRNRFRAVEFLAKVDARGGTEMAAPLDLAASTLGLQSGRDRILVMVTDGQVGNEDQILRMLAPKISGMRIFSVGIDSAVNEGFLKRLAALGAGACELVESEDRLDDVMDRIHTRIGTPVITGLQIEPSGLKIEKDSIEPSRFPALFAGAPLVITGRFKGRVEGGIAVGGVDATGSSWRETVRAVRCESRAVAHTWARGHLRDLEDRYTIGDTSLAPRILEVSLKFGVLCRFTAFVAVDKTEVVNRGGSNVKVTQPVDAPAGWDMFDAGAIDAVVSDANLQRSSASAGGRAKSASPAPVTASQATGSFAIGGMPGGANGAPPSPPKAQPMAKKPASRPQSVSSKVVATGKEKAERKDGAEADDGESALNLAPYRRRAAELVDEMRKAASEADDRRATIAGQLTLKLQALIEDLVSVGAEDFEINALREMRTDLLKMLAAKKPDVEAIWKRAIQTLEGFAGGSGSAKPKRRGLAFWK